MDRNSPFYMNLRRIRWKKLNQLKSPALGYSHLLSVCTCPEKSGHPGPQHDPACPCYATHRAELVKCKGVWIEQIPGRHGHYRKVLRGPVEFHLKEIS